MTPALDVLMPVGPGAQELARARDAIASVAAYEPQLGAVVLVDDGPTERGLARECAVDGVHVVAVCNPRGGRGEGVHGGLCAGIATGLAWLYRHGTSPLVLRIDTDGLAIAPFVQQVHDRLRRQPGVGIVGSYDFAPTRMPREFAVFDRMVRKLERPLWVYRRPPQAVRRVHLAVGPTRAAAVREQIATALANGYQRGENCLAGVCILTRELVERLGAAGYLDDPLTWLPTWLSDDLMLGIQARAVGLGLAGMTDDGEPFGIAQLQLPGPPEWLVSQGYSLIHPVKDRFGPGNEAAVRQFFRARRDAA